MVQGNLIIKDETWFGRGGSLGNANFEATCQKSIQYRPRENVNISN